jgi:hypothetical protein
MYSDEKKPRKRTWALAKFLFAVPRRSQIHFRRGPKEIKTVHDAWKRMGEMSHRNFWENFLQGEEFWDQDNVTPIDLFT